MVSPALAQGRGRVGAIGGALLLDADFADGTQTTVGVTAGLALLPWLDIEGDVLAPNGDVVREYTGTSVSFAAPGASREEIERLAVVSRFTNQRQTRSVVAVVAALHTRRTDRRITPRLFVGFASHRIRDRRTLEHVAFPPGITLKRVNRMMQAEDIHMRQIGGFSVGGSLALRVAPRIDVAPDVRDDYMSMGDEIYNAWRSSVRMTWRF